ncbi:predicted protein [Thalassiosira pseudonana CCMP1335]|uniref:Uncharacterized protein n=1 Tax=Thalassiosira pseudonana TaxID=35128 RepID=B8C652_THAPS|nr:predicted protein [Thalassiosira pseudonana CCMP1335]EED91234.1 predicted protein [Thalassiosira pseudonana CCMP1335]
MFDQYIDFSLNLPCRRLSAVAPRSTSSKSHFNEDGSNDNAADTTSNGWNDDEDDYLDTSYSPTTHRFLVASAFPSVSKLNNTDTTTTTEEEKGHTLIEEDDDERTTNRLYLLQYHEDSHELTMESSYVHPTGEVWSMACHPKRSEVVATCGGGAAFFGVGEECLGGLVAKFQTVLWRLLPQSGGSGDGTADEFGTSLSNNNMESGDDDFWGDNDNEELSRKRTESGTSAMGSSNKLEPLVTIPHGRNATIVTGWEQRVGCILWSPQLSSDGEVSDGDGSLLTVGWDVSSPLSLWDISPSNDVQEVWTTIGGSGVASSRRGRNNRFENMSALTSALPRRASWDPHETHHILATSGVDVVAYDMRCSASETASGGVGVIRSAHRYGVADVCHNQLQSNVVVTSGMDGVIKFWDLRMHLSSQSYGDDGLSAVGSGPNDTNGYTLLPTPPLLKAVRGGHTHWTTRAVYNPFYDQLVLSGGSDGIANLWRISSCSSAPLLELDGEDEEDIGGELHDDDVDEEDYDEGLNEDKKETEDWMDDNNQRPTNEDEDENDDKEQSSENYGASNTSRIESSAPDVRVAHFECSDTTADVAWSASDPWMYATLSYDGALVVHHVPSKEKYKILL